MTTQEIKFFRETALPVTLQPYSVYFIAPAGTPEYVEVYVTSFTGVPRRIIDKNDIQAMINASVSAATELIIVADIAARDALVLTSTRYVYVKDATGATGDTSVTSGGATYLYDPAGTPSPWIKVSESESLDVQVTWAALQDKPTSTVQQIDAAVANSHTHANKTQLDKIAEDANGNLTYGGSLPHTGWDSTGW